MIAEWEKSKGAGLTWDSYGGTNKFGIPDALIQALAARIPIFVGCPAGQQTACGNYLSNLGVSNYTFITAGTDTYWTRDYGPWCIFEGDARGRQMKILDFTYDRPARPVDNVVPQVIADFFSRPLYYMDMVHTGGNIMFDGNGAGMSTNLVKDENPQYTEQEIVTEFSKFLGISDYYIFQDPLININDTIDHMDLWCKLLDVDIVLIERVPTNHQNYAALETAVDLWEGLITSYGAPFRHRIFRVDCPNGEPYANSIIMNNTIYVPQMGGTHTDADAAALAVYKEAMPAYEVLGFLGKTSDPWLATDAIHCRVNSIWDPEMIHVWHVPLHGEVPASEPVNINVNISSTHPCIGDSTYVTYRYWDDSASVYTGWVTVPLTLGSGNNWSASIPGGAPGDSIFYAIRATDSMGTTHDERINGRYDPFVLYVRDGTLPVELSSFTVTQYSYNHVKIQWVTQTETNVSGFRLYRNTEDLLETAQMLDLFIPATNTSQMKVYLATDMEIYEEGTYYYWLENVDLNGESDFHGPIHIAVTFADAPSPGVPLVQGINNAYPNPFNPTVNIPCGMVKGGKTTVQIYNTRGQLVKTLFSGTKEKGNFLLQWNGTDQYDRKQPSGVYLIRMDSDNGRSTRKVVLSQ